MRDHDIRKAVERLQSFELMSALTRKLDEHDLMEDALRETVADLESLSEAGFNDGLHRKALFRMCSVLPENYDPTPE